MLPGGRQMTREQELRKAAEESGLSLLEYRIYHALLHHSDFGTADLPDKFQPRGLADLARWCELSKSALCKGLDSLERNGWVKRARTGSPGRGQVTTYAIQLGQKVSTTRTVPERKVSAKQAGKCPRPDPDIAGQNPVSAEGQRGVTVVGGRVRVVGCPWCGKQVALMSNGAMWEHNPPGVKFSRCSGSRRRPLAVVGA